MKFEDKGFLISKKKYNENSVIAEFYCENHGKWSVLHGSVLDEKFITDLGKFDIVYSWGVLHHTGSMWHGMENLLL